MSVFDLIAEKYINKTNEVKSLFAPKPIPVAETPFADYFKKKKKGATGDFGESEGVLEYMGKALKLAIPQFAQEPKANTLSWDVERMRQRHPPKDARTFAEMATPPAGAIPTPDVFGRQYFANKGWRIPNLGALKPSVEAAVSQDFDQKLREVSKAYISQYGMKEFLKAGGAKALRTLGTAATFLAPAGGAVVAPLMQLGAATAFTGATALDWQRMSDIDKVVNVALDALYLAKATKAVAVSPVGRKIGKEAARTLMSTGLDRWIAEQGRLNPPEQSKAYKIIANLSGSSKNKLINYASESWMERARGKTLVPRVDTVIADVVNEVSNKATSLIPKFTPGGSAVPGQTIPLAQMQATATNMTTTEGENLARKLREGKLGELGQPVVPGVVTPPPIVPPNQPPTQLPIINDMRRLYSDVGTEITAMKSALRNLKGEEAQVSRLTLKSLDKELVGIERTIKAFETKTAPPNIKDLRRQIVAVSVLKGFPKTELRQIIKDATGQGGLMTLPEGQLRVVLDKVSRIRPQRIKGKNVIAADTERDIASLKAELTKEGTFTDQSYKGLLHYLEIKTDKYETGDRFITEGEGKQLIRAMNNENMLGLAQKKIKLETALASQPELAKSIGDRQTITGNLQVGTTEGKKVSVNPFLDIRYYMQKLQVTTGQPFYQVWYDALTKKNDLMTRGKEIMTRIENSTPQFKVLSEDKVALQRVSDYIASKNKWSKVVSPTNITPDEIKLADAIEKELLAFRGDVRFYRFLRSYNRHNGDVELINRDIKDAPADDLRAAIKILESKGDKALRAFTDSKTWGVIESGYEPQTAINPRLQERKARIATIGAGHLNTREGFEASVDERTLLQRTSAYVRQMLNLQLEPYAQKIDEMYGQTLSLMDNPQRVKKELIQDLNSLKGYIEDGGMLAQILKRTASQGFTAIYLRPDMSFRNSLQNIAFHPDKEAFINPANRVLTSEEMDYFNQYVASDDAFAQEYMLQNSPGIPGLGKINKWAQKLTLFQLSERMNRLSSFWASLNKAERALKAYQTNKDVAAFTKASGLNDLTPTQQIQGLELLAADPKEATRFIAKEITNNVHMVYSQAERAVVQQGAMGSAIGSLMTFPRSYVQRMVLVAQKAFSSQSTTGERMRAWKILSTSIIGGLVAGSIYKMVTGKDRDPYNPVEMITWTPGGLMIGATTQIAEVLGDISRAIQGDEAALMRLPAKLTQAGDTFLPFYKQVIDGLEAIENEKNVDRLAVRKVIALIKKDYHPDEDSYQTERNIIESLQHVVFGTEAEEMGNPIVAKFAREWEADLNAYNAIPTDPIEVKAKRLQSRTQYRETHPDIDAKLFVLGETTALQSYAAVTRVMNIITENKIDPNDIKGVQEYLKEEAKREKLGVRNTGKLTNTDSLMKRIKAMTNQPAPTQTLTTTPTKAPAAPAPTQTMPQPTQSTPLGASGKQWAEISSVGGLPFLQATNKVWFSGGTLTPDEDRLLRSIFQKYPLGQSDYDVWLKQRLRQLYMQSTLGK